MNRWLAVAVAACACGPKPFRVEGERAQRLTECGGSLSLLGDWTKETSGALVGRAPVESIERIERGIRVGLGEARSFVIGLDPALPAPLAVGDVVDVSITCQPIGRDAVGCSGAVLGARSEVIAFTTQTLSGVCDGSWTVPTPAIARSSRRARS